MAKEATIKKSDNIFNSERKTINIDVKDAADAAQNMTGWSLRWSFKGEKGGTTHFTKTTGLSEITIGNGVGTGDRAAVLVLPTNWSALAEGWYWHELSRIDALNEMLLAFGEFYLHKP